VINQRLPFHCSTRDEPAANGEAKAPTAIQVVGNEHDTPYSAVQSAPGVEGIHQRLPFQRSTNAATPRPM
jgi:hypothetical protein